MLELAFVKDVFCDNIIVNIKSHMYPNKKSNNIRYYSDGETAAQLFKRNNKQIKNWYNIYVKIYGKSDRIGG